MATAEEIEGEWVDPDWDSSLIDRLRDLWSKPIEKFQNADLALFLRQKVALEVVIPLAEDRLTSGLDDDSELYDGELAECLQRAKSRLKKT